MSISNSRMSYLNVKMNMNMEMVDIDDNEERNDTINGPSMPSRAGPFLPAPSGPSTTSLSHHFLARIHSCRNRREYLHFRESLEDVNVILLVACIKVHLLFTYTVLRLDHYLCTSGVSIASIRLHKSCLTTSTSSWHRYQHEDHYTSMIHALTKYSSQSRISFPIMPRNKAFYPQREPHSNRPHLHLHHEHVHGPFASFNPTTARYSAHSASLERLIDKNQDEKKVPSQSSSDDAYNAAEDPNSQSTLPTNTAQDNTISNSTTPAHDISFEWRSRDNRKGRTLLLVDTDASSNSKTPYLVPRSSKSAQEIFKVVKIMATQCWYWDVSYLVATIFTLGSVIWVINAFFVYLPLAQPSTEFKNEIAYGGGITAFLGATVFEIGSVLLMFEAVNANQSGCFGWAMEKLVDEHFRPHENGEKIRIIPNGDISDHHMNKNSIGGRHIVTDGTKDGKSWRWFPTTLELKTHYMYELGFLASFAQLFGATVFWISGFTALPGIQDKMSQGLLDGIYWVPQIVGGTGFIVSG